MHRALSRLPKAPADPNVVLGHESFDDAGVYRIAPDLVLIQTVDFFTPVVDDPYDFGQIAAANALSDVYAMGGRPRTALNLVCWPPAGLDPEILGDILAGGAEKADEAGCALVGGHSVQDEELKYGLAVTGTAHPGEVTTNAGARPGEAVVITKPLGTGILTTALKNGAVDEASIADAVEAMKALNSSAMEAGREAGVGTVTDVTGFGLVGHAAEVAEASDITLTVEAAAVPRFPRAEKLASEGHVPGGSLSNRDYLTPRVRIDDDVPESVRWILFDPQTSGGLLLVVPEDRVDELIDRLGRVGWISSARIGTIEPRQDVAVRVV